MANYIDDLGRVTEQHARTLITYIEENGATDPWTLLAETDLNGIDSEQCRVHVLRPLILEDVLTITEDGAIQIMKAERLGNLL